MKNVDQLLLFRSMLSSIQISLLFDSFFLFFFLFLFSNLVSYFGFYFSIFCVNVSPCPSILGSLILIECCTFFLWSMHKTFLYVFSLILRSFIMKEEINNHRIKLEKNQLQDLPRSITVC